MKMFKTKFCSILVLVSMMLLAGCETVDWLKSNSTATEYAVKIAVIELIENGDVSSQSVISTTDQALKYMDKNPDGKASDIIGFVKDTIPWEKLTQPQAVLINVILLSLQEKIATDIERGIVSKDTYVSVKEVITWVNDAASMVKQ
jgi:hypothetical protein